MKTWPVVAWIAAALLPLASPGAFADAMRCGSKLVSEEDTREQVISKCGPATEVQHSSVWRVPVAWIHGRPYRVGNDLAEVPVELWIYNFGPNKFMRRVRFEDGLVVEVETLGYGYIKK